MPHPFDIEALAQQAREAVSAVVGRDAAEIRGFSQRQLTALAKQAAWIAEATVLGELDRDLRDFFLDQLEQMARNFALTLRGLLVITIERVWNAIVDVLWAAIGRTIGAVLPRVV